jgi:hypothetical protein
VHPLLAFCAVTSGLPGKPPTTHKHPLNNHLTSAPRLPLPWPQGVFLGAAVSAAMALLAPNSPLPHLLGVFFKEDLLSAVNRRGKAPSLMTNDKLKNMVNNNITKVRLSATGYGRGWQGRGEGAGLLGQGATEGALWSMRRNPVPWQTVYTTTTCQLHLSVPPTTWAHQAQAVCVATVSPVSTPAHVQATPQSPHNSLFRPRFALCFTCVHHVCVPCDTR